MMQIEVIGKLNRRARSSRAAMLLASLGICLLPLETIRAGAPEYMQLNAEVGMALEIEGTWDSSGVFVADEIEVLPRERSPKLRGSIQAVDATAGTITIYGVTIAVDSRTEFVRDGGPKFGLGDLAPGDRAEVSCKVDGKGLWRAQKIRAHGVKSSDKVKGTITRLHIDGEAPDTLDFGGLLILLVRESDILKSEGNLEDTEREIFGQYKVRGAREMSRGIAVSDRLHVSAQYRFNFYDDSNYDLSSGSETDLRLTENQVRARATADFGRPLRIHAYIKLDSWQYLVQERSTSIENFEASVLELSAVMRHPHRGIAAQIGRQRFREPREWIYDEYQDAVRFYYYDHEHLQVETALLHAVGSPDASFATWTDLLVQTRWLFDEDNHVAGYVLARWDSDSIRNRQPVWWGLRYIGRPVRSLRPWVDAAVMRGQDKYRTLRAWAVDVGATWTARRVPMRPALTLAFATSSGDADGGDGVDRRFRQTDYEDNVARLGGIARTKYYGNVLDPELSNLTVVTAAAAVRPLPDMSVECLYHDYLQRVADADLKGSDLVDPPARPNGASNELGWGLDLVVTFPEIFNLLNVKYTFGLFKPGLAYEPRRETAYLNQINLWITV